MKESLGNGYSRDQIIASLGAAGVSIYGESQSNVMVFCPFHHNVNTPAGEVSTETGTFFCFSCKHVASFSDYMMKVTGLEYFQTMRLINKYKDSDEIDATIDRLLQDKTAAKVYDPKLIERLHSSAMGSDRAKKYLASRGITEESMVKFKIGYSDKLDMVTYPFCNSDASEYYGFEGRSIEGKRFQCEGNKSNTLFNLPNTIWNDRVYLVESIVDCIRLHQLGIPAIASMGTNHSKTQIGMLVRYFLEVFIIQDNDDEGNGFAGQASAQKLQEKIAPHGIIVKPPNGYKDVGDMPDDEIKELVARTNSILGDF